MNVLIEFHCGIDLGGVVYCVYFMFVLICLDCAGFVACRIAMLLLVCFCVSYNCLVVFALVNFELFVSFFCFYLLLEVIWGLGLIVLGSYGGLVSFQDAWVLPCLVLLIAVFNYLLLFALGTLVSLVLGTGLITCAYCL